MQISIEKKDNQKPETKKKLLNTTWITKPVNGANYRPITVRMTASRIILITISLVESIYYIKLQFSLSVCLYPPFFDTTVGPQPNLAHIFG